MNEKKDFLEVYRISEVLDNAETLSVNQVMDLVN